MNLNHIPPSWLDVIGDEFDKPYFQQLKAYIDRERQEHKVFPPEDDVFNALRWTPYNEVRVLLLGQDPYHDDGQAHGLAFSVLPGVRTPPSLANMYKELVTDIPEFQVPRHGYLEGWARQGVLLLNTVLTVRAHTPASHKAQGWETFTDAVIKAVNARKEPVVFLLLGGHAQKKVKLIDEKRHSVIQAAHPSPLSAKSFFGSRIFSRVNAALSEQGNTPIDWQLPLEVEARGWESAGAGIGTSACPFSPGKNLTFS